MLRKLQKVANVIFIRRSMISVYVSAILGDRDCVTVTYVTMVTWTVHIDAWKRYRSSLLRYRYVR